MRDDGSKLGSSTKPGGWFAVGDEEAVARRISFSVCARCSMSFSLSLSDCSDEVVVVSRLSLASRSRTCLSLRSRKARCLDKRVSSGFPLCLGRGSVRRSVLCLSPRLCGCQTVLLFATTSSALGHVVHVECDSAVHRAIRKHRQLLGWRRRGSCWERCETSTRAQ